MNWRQPARLAGPSNTAVALWAVAVAFFGVGDLVTTLVGYSITGVTELSPVVKLLLEQRAMLVLTGLKAAVFVGFFAIWKWISWPYSIGIPLGLALLGVAVTAWNTGIILTAVLA
ncbi:hypothetical protein SAMN05443574_101149 [Haloarcula vallismortis]|uniref:DUF5658 domain-containing protein n=2 Tax=Haloarcula vallismortis TaxID=28442 RepID=M0IV59_HALVA|nr:hypothetical protein [Haloarcula vallismortis]EMA00727.1 hypothetical protein C437_18052 [Haloarcula vallismortis ATCC 29715]SDW04196.1 hypothetical protein SAMN05443574_101149 [Haloarcula vallismortis]